jgi:hypothetical protein
MDVLLSNRALLCSIMHEDTHHCTVKDLPSTWMVVVDNGTVRPVCSATLPCGHHYHVSALALHFMCNQMRCAVCRRGIDEKMRESVLPETIRAEFSKRVTDITDNTRDNTTESRDVFHYNQIRYDPIVYTNNFLFILEHVGHDVPSVVQQSPCVTHIQTPENANDPNLQNIICRPQYWMSRHIQRTVNNSSADTLLRVGITHPLLLLPITTDTLLLDTQESVRNVSLCATWAHHEPVGSVCISQEQCIFKIRLGTIQELMTRSVNEMLRVHFQAGY